MYPKAQDVSTLKERYSRGNHSGDFVSNVNTAMLTQHGLTKTDTRTMVGDLTSGGRKDYWLNK